MNKKKFIFSKRVLPILLVLSMLLGAFPFMGVASSADESVLFRSFA